MIRITNEEDEVESQLINWEQDVFNFERFLDQMLIFSWISMTIRVTAWLAG